MNKKIVEDIIKTRNIIRKKYSSLKSGRLENESHFEQIFQPITSPLKKLVNATKENPLIKSELKRSADNLNITSPLEKIKKVKSDDETSNFQSFPTEFNQFLEAEPGFINPSDLGSSSNIQQEKQLVDDSQLDSLQSTYKFIRQLNIYHKDFDYKYGPNFNSNDNVWKIGSSPFLINNGNISINDRVYSLTSGLRILIFLKKPNVEECSEDDISKYLEIVEGSNLLHRNYDKTQQFAGSKSFKYNLIKDLSQRFHTQAHVGSGLLEFSSKKPEYVYWDDPNELVDRLRLLLASQQAGHTNHNNEIISIFEELREAKIII